MVSRREKLKLLQSKAQEQMFNLHVKLTNQEMSAGEFSEKQHRLRDFLFVPADLRAGHVTQKNTKQSSDSAQFRGIIPHRIIFNLSKLFSEKLVIFDPYEKFLCILPVNEQVETNTRYVIRRRSRQYHKLIL